MAAPVASAPSTLVSAGGTTDTDVGGAGSRGTGAGAGDKI